MSLLPNLLVYDAALVLQAAQESSPVHLALAIVVEARRSLGVNSQVVNECRIGDAALLLMAFGDGLLPKKRYRATNEKKSNDSELDEKVTLEKMVKEMEAVYRMVEKLQFSLYNKTFPSMSMSSQVPEGQNTQEKATA
jgi:hypothetical protein